jgi:hypothetical protein
MKSAEKASREKDVGFESQYYDDVATLSQARPSLCWLRKLPNT